MDSAATPPEKNHWVRPVAIGVLLMMMVWNATGWLVDKGATAEGLFLVVFTLGLMSLGINASSQMRRCYARVQTPAVVAASRFWKLVLISTSLWSAGSAHHAYGQLVANEVVWGWSFEAVFALLNAAPLLIVLTAAAFFEPLLMWAIETVEHAARAPVPGVVSPLKNMGETPAPAEAPRPPRSVPTATRERPGIVEKSTPSLPLTEQELELAVQSIVNRDGAKVVSLASVAREAETILGRPVPKKRVENHPKRREVFERYKGAA